MTAHIAWFVIVSGVTSFVSIVFWRLVPRGERLSFAIVTLGIVALGATVGLHGGLSRIGVVGQIMAAVLGLLGGLVLWIFSVKREDGPVASVLVLALSLSIFLAYREGSRLRLSVDTYEFWRTNCTEIYLSIDPSTSLERFSLM